MIIEIRKRYSNSLIHSGDFENISLALIDALKKGADLRSADLRSADLRSADLSGADLSGANLSGANLRSADLRSASGINTNRSTSILLLLDQPGKIRLYKLVTNDLMSPTHNLRLKYEIGSELEVKNANINPFEDCGAGINVADMPWIMREWQPTNRILIVEFEAKDIACIPIATDGKIRLYRCKVVGEKDLNKLGLI